MYPILFEVFGIKIFSYGTMMAVAFALAIVLAMLRARKEGVEPELILDLGLLIIISSMVGSRIIYIINSPGEFLNKPFDVFKIWQGGLVFYGGLIFAYLSAYFYLRWKKANVWKVADILAPSIAVGQALGRIGCFLFGCCYGKPVSWGFVFHTNPGAHVHPTQLYSSGKDLLIFALLVLFRNKKKFDGQVFGLYLMLYAVARFVVEFWRGDDVLHIGFLRISQYISFGIFAAGLALYVILHSKSIMNQKQKKGKK